MENTLVEQQKSETPTLVVACIADHPKARSLLRAARNRAAQINGKWRALFIETPEYESQEEGAHSRIQQLLALAAQMGGETAHIHADSLNKGILRILDEEKGHLSAIIMGDGRAPRGLYRLQASPLDRAMQEARKRHVDIELVPLYEANYRQSFIERLRWIKFRHIGFALLAVGVAMLCVSVLEALLPPALFRINDQNVCLLFMIACAFAAGRFGLLPGLVASGSSFLIVNYFFTVPYGAFKFNNLTDSLNLLVFLSAAVLISFFNSQTRNYAQRAAKRELNTQALFTLYRLAANASSRKQALEELQQKLTRMLMMEVAFFLPMQDVADMTTVPEGVTLSETDAAALALCLKEMKTVGLASRLKPHSKWRFEPMIAPDGEIGALGVRPRHAGQIDAWFGRLLTAIADQTAAVLEHIELEKTMEAGRIREEREKLRSMLLSSVSHDLRTPLSSIIGALRIYRSHGGNLAPEKRQALLDTALQESERLDSFITNILNMTQLESGQIEFKQDWGDMHGLLQHVIKRLEDRLSQHKIQLHAFQRIDVLMDVMMTEQVVQNLLDNACKYTPAGTVIEIDCGVAGEKGFYCAIRDRGVGLPEEKLDCVFDKYARLQKQDSQIAGTGLGLAICKAMMEAQGGSISAANHPDGGAVFTFYLPQWREADTTKYVA